MSRYIRQYISICDLCLRTKPIRQAPVVKLHPLRIPDSWWDTLSVDFVVELPLSSRHDTVMTVVNSVSKRAHFIPTHTMVTVEGAARFFLHQVWKLHGLLKCIISDHRPQFVVRFTRELYHLLGIKLASSTAWHPQTDRACQPGVGPVPPALCEWEARRLVQPITHGGVPAQQSHPLHHPIAFVSARHQMTSSHGLWTPAEPFQSRDSQQVHRKNEDSNRRS